MNALIIGKFAPFHKGHESLVKRAVSDGCKHIYIVCYNNKRFDEENPFLSKWLRVNWITEYLNSKKSYRDATFHVIAGNNPPDDIPGQIGNHIHSAYLMGIVNVKIDRMYGSEDYVRDIADFMGAIPVIVDLNRSKLNISATMVRENPELYKNMVPKTIYKKFIENKERYKYYVKHNVTEGDIERVHSNVHIPEDIMGRFLQKKNHIILINKMIKWNNMKGNNLSDIPVIVQLLKEWTGNSIVVAGTGHRPKYTTVKGEAPYPKENSYAYERLVSCARFALDKVCADRVITGGALGWDMALAEAAFQLNIYHILAQPHEEHINSFTASETKKYYQSIIDRSDEVISVSTGGYSVEKLDIRNKWMVDNCHLVVALWNGQNSGTGNAVSYATNKFVPVVNFWSMWEAYKER